MLGEEVIAVYGDAGDGEELFEVQKLVRCKECIYYSDGECKCGLLPFSEYSDTANLWVTPKPDDFCSYGERRASDDR